MNSSFFEAGLQAQKVAPSFTNKAGGVLLDGRSETGGICLLSLRARRSTRKQAFKTLPEFTSVITSLSTHALLQSRQASC